MTEQIKNNLEQFRIHSSPASKPVLFSFPHTRIIDQSTYRRNTSFYHPLNKPQPLVLLDTSADMDRLDGIT